MLSGWRDWQSDPHRRGADEKLKKSVQNIATVAFVPSSRVTARDIVNAQRVVATQGAIEKLQEVLA
jgi:ribosomal protein L4